MKKSNMIYQEKIKEFVDLFLKHVEEIGIVRHVNQEEGYKFKYVDHFQKYFNIDAKNLCGMLETAIQDNNLVTGYHYLPRKILLIFAEEFEKETRNALRLLFDESVEVSKRIDSVEEIFDNLIKQRNEKLRENERSFIGIRFLSLLLALRYPGKHNAVKPREWKRFCKFIDDEFKSSKGSTNGEEYNIYGEYIDALRLYIKAVPGVEKLREKITQGIEFKDSEYRWIAQDIIFITSGLLKKKTPTDGKKEESKFESAEKEIIDEMTPSPPLSNMKIKPLPISFDSLLKDIERGLIQIPPFQRNFIWSPKEIAFLLDSIYRGYPIGSFIFWKTIRRLERMRQIGDLSLPEPPPGALIDYVLDGQQRVTSLYAAIRGASIEDEYIRFYFNIEQSRFEYNRFDDSSTENNDQSQGLLRVPLEKIFVEPTQYYRYVGNFPEQYQNVLHELYNRFERYAFSVIYVQDEDELQIPVIGQDNLKKIVHIFSRINETGRKLTVVAKMVARCWGEGFDLRGRLNELFSTDEELVEIREETVLQIASAILNNKKARTRNILEDTDISELEGSWDEIVQAFKQSLDFLKNKIRIKNFKYIPFDSVLVPLSYFHYKNHNPAPEQSEQLFLWFWRACLSNRFGATVEARCEEDCTLFDKILNGEKVEFKYPIDWETFHQRLIDQNYSLKNAFSKTIFSLYSYFQPKDFRDNRDINLGKNYSDYNKLNLHHFFSKDHLERDGGENKKYKESIVNIAFAPKITNISIGAEAPGEYIGELLKINPDLKGTLKTHLIDGVSEFGITDNNFSLFLRKRAEKIENEFRSFLGLRTKTENQFEEGPAVLIDIFEIRMRTLLDSRLKSEFGENYWIEAIPEDVRAAADTKIQKDLRVHPYNESKYLDCFERLNFLDIMDYLKILNSNWLLFRDIFMSRGELQRHFFALNGYRNAIKHNRELDIVDKKNGEAAILWFEKVFEVIKDKN